MLRWVTGRLLPRVAYPVVRGPLRGRWFVLGAAGGAGGGASVFVNWVEPEKTAALLEVFKRGQVVFDIGANVGYYTMLASELVGPDGLVLAFEPSTRNLSYLYRHQVLNRATNVAVIPAACSDRPGLAMFENNEDCAEGGLADPHGGASSTASLVATTTVDDVVSASGRIPDVMKIDVEGAELRVLHGAAATLASARPTLVLAVHSGAIREQCLAFLADLGYVAEVICGDAHGDMELLVRHRGAAAPESARSNG